MAEGLVRVSNLSDDYYTLFTDKQALIGQRTGRSFKLGQKIKGQAGRRQPGASGSGPAAGGLRPAPNTPLHSIEKPRHINFAAAFLFPKRLYFPFSLAHITPAITKANVTDAVHALTIPGQP